ncbi:MAG: DUF2752 domain-containing protein [Actinobacteria bacterium]|nr:DUF2752 domain-containing protein [Actinomycetota bacterium]
MKIKIVSQSFVNLQVGLAYTVIGIIGLALVYFAPQAINYFPPCLFRSWTGIRCPACGATHTGLYLSHLHIVQAFLTNPLFFFLFILLALWSVNSIIGLFLKQNLKFILTNREKKIIRRIIIWSIPVNWLYLIIISLLGK